MTTWNEKDHPRRNDGTPGKTQFAAKTNTASTLTLKAPGVPDWDTHSDAVNGAAASIGLHTGEKNQYRSTALLVNPDGHAEASVNLGKSGVGSGAQLRHDYATGVTTLEDFEAKTKTTDPDTVNAVVRDVYGLNRSSKDLFWKLREETLADGAVHPTVKGVLAGDNHVYPRHSLHQAALAEAADQTGIRSGHAYEYKFTSMQTNPHGEAEAWVHLDDGDPYTHLTHNYATGTTTYTSHDRGIVDSTYQELIDVAVEDICPGSEGGAAGMFNRLRENSLKAEGLDHRIRASLTREHKGRAVSLAGLTETPRTVTPDEHRIKGLGNIDISRAGKDVRIAMSLPEDTQFPDLGTWDSGIADVDAHPEMVSVLEEHLGIQPGDPDALTFEKGQPTYAHYESLGSSTKIDPDDLAAWSSDFTALADPAIQNDLASDIAELYHNGLR